MRIEVLINGISDRDEQWGPLLFLRPDRHRPLSTLRLAALALLLGALFGMAGSVLLAVIARAFEKPIPPVYVMPLAMTFVYFVVGQFTVARAWNRRARRLAKLR